MLHKYRDYYFSLAQQFDVNFPTNDAATACVSSVSRSLCNNLVNRPEKPRANGRLTANYCDFIASLARRLLVLTNLQPRPTSLPLATLRLCAAHTTKHLVVVHTQYARAACVYAKRFSFFLRMSSFIRCIFSGGFLKNCVSTFKQ